MESSAVSFKATINGLILILREEDSFEEVYEQVGKKIESSKRFFSGASISVKYRGKKLTPDQEEKLRRLLESGANVEIKSFEEDKDYQEKAPKESKPASGKIPLRRMYYKGIEEGMTRFHQGTLRSGQIVSFEGNVVIIGDVNPGAQVEATGNVIVMGNLRGIVHAGADGNKNAIVAALNLQPTQLRIADIITRPPDENENKSVMIPEMAFVKDDMVYIERFLPQYK